MYNDIFSRESARSSVIELSQKTKQLKQDRRIALAHARAARAAVNERRQPIPAYWADSWPVARMERVYPPTRCVLDPNYDDVSKLYDRALERGSCARYHGLAYAFLRGRAYRQCEQRTRASKIVSARVLVEVLWHHLLPGLDAALLRKTLTPQLLDDVTAWLAVPLPSCA